MPSSVSAAPMAALQEEVLPEGVQVRASCERVVSCGVRGWNVSVSVLSVQRLAVQVMVYAGLLPVSLRDDGGGLTARSQLGEMLSMMVAWRVAPELSV